MYACRASSSFLDDGFSSRARRTSRRAGDAAALAERLEEENRLEEAKAQLDEALALFPENAELRGKLARVEDQQFFG